MRPTRLEEKKMRHKVYLQRGQLFKQMIKKIQVKIWLETELATVFTGENI